MNRLLILTLSLKEILTLVFVRWWVPYHTIPPWYTIPYALVFVRWWVDQIWEFPEQWQLPGDPIHSRSTSTLIINSRYFLFHILLLNQKCSIHQKKASFFHRLRISPIQFPFVPKWLDTACNQTLAGRSQSQTVAAHFSPNLSPKNQQIKGRLACNQIWPFVVPACQTVSDCCGFGTLSKKSVLTSSKVWIWSEHLRDKCQSFSKLFLRTKRQFLHLDKRQRPGGISSGLFCAPLNQSRLQSGITKLLHMCTYSFACKNAQMDYTILKKW